MTIEKLIERGNEINVKDNEQLLAWFYDLRVFCEQSDCPIKGATLATLKRDIENGWDDIEKTDRKKEFKGKILFILERNK